jgi:hypothetical protein
MRTTVERPAVVDAHIDIDSLKHEFENKHAEIGKADTASAILKREAGEILLRMKKKIGKRWKAWVNKNLRIHYRTVARYMRIATKWPEIEKKLEERVPDKDSARPDLCTFSATAVLRTILEQRAEGKKSVAPKLPRRLAPFAEKVQKVARGLGVKAPGGAIIGLMRHLGIPDAALVKYFEKWDGETEKNGE